MTIEYKIVTPAVINPNLKDFIKTAPYTDEPEADKTYVWTIPYIINPN